MAADFELDEGREPYEKQSGETMNSFAAFAVFRDLGPQRTLPKAAEAIGKSLSMLQGWSSKYRWFERAEEYDLVVDARHREQQQTLRDQVLESHRFLGQLGVNAAIERVQGREPGTNGPDDPGVAPLDPGSMDWQAWARVQAESVRTSRQAMGEPTDFIRGALSPTPAAVERIVLTVVEILMGYVPENRQQVAFAEVDAYLNGGGAPPALTAG